MFKKLIASLILLLLSIGLFEINLTEVSDSIWNTVQRNEQKIQTEHTPSDISFNGKAITIGGDLNTVIETFGSSIDVLLSEYGFLWYIYHDNYKDYIQIGIGDNQVVGIYSNSPDFQINGIGVGSTVADVNTTFGTPLEYIIKGTTKYIQHRIIDEKHEMDVFEYRSMYITVYYDIFEDNTVTSIGVVETATELGFDAAYPYGSTNLKYSFEMQNFYVTNARRVREGLAPFSWSEPMAYIAERHSKDMSDNNYFEHENLQGKSVADRAQAAGITYSTIGENIAAGAQNSIVMHELLMNSEGHRMNILGNFKYLGVGVWFNFENRPYLTQNFFNPPKIIIG